METTVKFITNLIQLYLIWKVIKIAAKISTGRLFCFRNKHFDKKYSVLYKLYRLAINPIIYKLDDLLAEQKNKRLATLQEREVLQNKYNDKVIHFKEIYKNKSKYAK